jgi:hypothetical protein
VPKLRSEDQRLGLTLAQFVTKSLPAHILDEELKGSSQLAWRESGGITGSLMPKSSLR